MHQTQSQKQTGLSLIELMIAMVVGLILIAGVLSIFISSHKSYSINGAVAHIQENGRFALELIRTATRKAGYMACAPNTDLSNQLSSPANVSLPYDFATALTGFEYSGTTPGSGAYSITAENPAAVAAGNWSPTLDPSLPVGGADYAIPGSDVLVVRYSLDGENPMYITASSGTASTLSVNSGLDSNGNTGTIIAVSNCVQSAIYQATANGTTLTVSTGGGGNGPGNQSTIPATDVGWQVAAVTTQVFYIGHSPDGSPALFEAITTPGLVSGFQYQELVPGVENMQVLYGVANVAGSRTPNEYDTASAVPDWSNVVSVRVALLMRSETGALPIPTQAPQYNLLGTTIIAPRDTRLRRVFTANIAIRNPQ